MKGLGVTFQIENSGIVGTPLSPLLDVWDGGWKN